ncbi:MULTISPECIES: universal stress protein [unclassified Kribbella]|uniref:universal stress protein n=1 Tax=unclassified Kribbella TaxID=2644121 RepID=UPI0030184002
MVVVPDNWVRNESEIGMVVVGVDGSDACQPALGFAFEFAAERGAGLTIVHVPRAPPQDFPPPGIWIDPEDTPWYRDARQLITESLAGWPDKYPNVKFRTHYRPGHPVQVLAQHSKAADLIVVGGVGRVKFTPLRLGSVSRGLLHHTKCPVAIVHIGVAGLTPSPDMLVSLEAPRTARVRTPMALASATVVRHHAAARARGLEVDRGVPQRPGP